MSSGKDSLKVELLYFDGCPSYQTAAKLLRAVMDDEGLTAGIDLIKVADEAAARRLKFAGSPTIRIDGIDPFRRGEADYGMGCRVYVTPEGLKGWPTKVMLREALKETIG